jgi:hypothetical protein
MEAILKGDLPADPDTAAPQISQALKARLQGAPKRR